jgi:hypothetical protein
MCHQNTRQTYNKIANIFFENVKNFKYLKIAVTNSLIHSFIHSFSLFSLNILQVDKPGCGNGQYKYRVRLPVLKCTRQNTSSYMYKFA